MVMNRLSHLTEHGKKCPSFKSALSTALFFELKRSSKSLRISEQHLRSNQILDIVKKVFGDFTNAIRERRGDDSPNLP